MNNVSIMGRLCADPEIRTTSNGVEVTSFAIAVDRTFTPKGQEKQTDFIDCVAWRNTALFINRYFRKGEMIAITGELQTRTYEDKNKNKRKVTEVIINKADFCGSKKQSTEELPPPAFDPVTAEFNENDLPF